MVDRLTNLIAIFQKPELDFSQNRADHDDILGDAYEYLMRHFATESGKSKGQFYTPAEVSRVIAKVIAILPNNTKASTTAYDPTWRVVDINALRALAPRPCAPVPRASRPQPRTPPPAGAAGTARSRVEDWRGAP